MTNPLRGFNVSKKRERDQLICQTRWFREGFEGGILQRQQR